VLIKADLVGAHLTRANLSEANIAEANLIGANLAEAILAGANLAQANLARANLTGAVLLQAREQDIKLGKLAMDPKNLRNWSQVEDQFYKENPIKGPWSEAPVTIRSAQERDALKPGTRYIAPDGSVRTRQ
jgi:uncharacterized protein YjbI with pentapeptide repeats